MAETGPNAAIDTPDGIYLVQGLDRFALGGDLRGEVTATVAAHRERFGKPPRAVIWDDGVLGFRVRTMSFTLQRVFVPPGDPLLAAALDSSGRAAVRADVVPETGLQTTDVLGGLSWPADVAHAPGLLRLIGWPEQAPLRDSPPPQPSRHAASISVVINYRDKAATTIACMDHIRAQRLDATLELLLVDNRSREEERAAVEAAARRLFESDPRCSVRHIAFDADFNHSLQCNTAADQSSGEVLVMMSNDCDLIDPDTLQTLADWALEPGAGAVGPRLLGERGAVQGAGIAIGPRRNAAPDEIHIHEAEVDYLSRLLRRSNGASFACAAISKASWNQVGGADARAFPIDYNDADFCLRLTKAGYVNLYTGHVSARHQAGMKDVRTLESGEALHARLAERHEVADLPRLNPYAEPIKIYPDFASRTAQAIADFTRTYRKALDWYRSNEAVPGELREAFEALAAAAGSAGDALADGQRQVVEPAIRAVCTAMIANAPRGTLARRHYKSFEMLDASFAEWRKAAGRPVVPLVPAALSGSAEPDLSDPDAGGDFVGFSDAQFAGARHRLLVFADEFGPSQQVMFLEGLQHGRRKGSVAVRLFAESDLLRLRSAQGVAGLSAYLERTAAHVCPTAIIYSRMTDHGCHAAIEAVVAERNIPRLCHVDDDLFSLPAVNGVDRYREGRHPRRIHGLQQIAGEADLILAATPILAQRLAERFGAARIGLCEMSRAGLPFDREPHDTPLTIGYFGSATHNRDLEMVAPALERIKAEHPTIAIEIVGSIAKLSVAASLKGNVVRRPELEHDYARFRQKMRGWNWGIGLAPLGANTFNAAKTPIKWTEYAQAGIAVIASRAEPYLELGREGALLLAGPDEWHGRLTELIRHRSRRTALVRRSNAMLQAYGGWSAMEERLLGLLDRAAARRSAERVAA